MGYVRIVFVVTLCFISLGLLAQPDFELLRSKYPKEDVVYLYQKEHLIITLDGDELKVRDDVSESMAFLTGNDLRYSKESVYYNSFSEIADVVAYTMVPGKKKHEQVVVANFEHKDAISGGVFYDDHKKIQFVFPQVQNEAYTTLSYTEHIKDPRMLGSFFFNSFIPVMESTYQVTLPKQVELAYELMGEDTDKIEFTKKEQGDNVTYTWTARELPKLAFEKNAPSRNYYAPHVVVRITSYQAGGEQKNVLRNIDDLYSWYAELVAKTDNTITPEIKKLVEDLIRDAKTDEEKAANIFRWVQQHITYVAFEDGMGGFIPRSAGSVCSKKYGDCKDMANLLMVMLTEAGLEAHRTWIGTRDRPYAYEKVPTPIVDNHMIAAVKLNGKLVFLDATGQYTPFGMPTGMIQGKEALVEQGPTKFAIVKVPVMPSDRSVRNDETIITINNGNISGKGKASWTGYLKVDLEYDYYGSDDKDMNKFMNKVLTKGSNKFSLGNVKVSGLQDPGAILTATYDFSIPGYVKEVAGKLYVNMHLDKAWSAENIDLSTRHYPYEFDNKRQLQYSVQLELPEGYKLDYLPGELNYEGDDFAFAISYTLEGNKIILNKKLVLDTLMLEKEDMKDWNTFIESLNKAYKETVVLTQTK